jgi:hypothetical protein
MLQVYYLHPYGPSVLLKRSDNLQGNLAFSLAAHHHAHVGVLDVEIFGHSIPKLLGLEASRELDLRVSATLAGATC